MGLIFWWMLLIWLLAIAGFWIARYFLSSQRKRKMAPSLLAVAHTNRMTGLEEYKTTLRRYRLIVGWAAGLMTLGLLLSIILSARPANISIVTPTEQNRDIMLCLDASGSVLREDTALINRFSALVTNFSGQRFGLTLFNSSAVTIIPLNDNYKLISQQLTSYAKAFKAQKGALFTVLTDGTLANFQNGTSLVSDGYASCIEHMGTNTGHRSQSIILATDNEVQGTPIVSMVQAIAIAKRANIHTYTIDPGVSDSSLADDHAQLKIVASQTAGNYYQLSNPDTVSSIISSIATQQQGSFIGLPQPAVNDNPKPFLYIAALALAISLVLLWRLEL